MPKRTGRSNVGPEGPIGLPGLDGTDGLSAYEIAVANGFVGTEADWLASLVGPQGPTGTVGAHNHDDRYSLLGHTHAGLYAPLSHSHTTDDITSGTFAASFIPSLPTSKITSGIFGVARIPDLDAAKITTGVLAAARLPTHAHSGADITSGTIDAVRIPSLDATKIGSGTLADARIPSLSATKITSGTFGAARLGSGTATSATILYGDSTWKPAPTALLPVTSAGRRDTIQTVATTGTHTLCSTSVTLAAGTTYEVIAIGTLDSYGNAGDAWFSIRIAHSGGTSTSPLTTSAQGVNNGKTWVRSTTVAGTGAAVPVDLQLVWSSGDLRVRFSTITVMAFPI